MRTPWIWNDRSAAARAVRLPLLPPAWAFGAAVALRAAAYRWRVLPQTDVGVPVISIGNRSVGGTGKTPLAAWVAGHYAAQGLQPGIVLRGYGGDEALVHRRLVPGAVVVEGADRVRAARAAVASGANVVILDDGFQRLDLCRALDIVLLSADQGRAVPWTLPAGPWREGAAALSRADLIVVTRKAADQVSTSRLEDEAARYGVPVAVASLQPMGLAGMQSELVTPLRNLDGRRGLLVTGIADPAALRTQLERSGLVVVEMRFADHHRFVSGDVKKMLRASRGVDYVIVTEKDAVKLRALWPSTEAEPLVTQLKVEWERGGGVVKAALQVALAKRTNGKRKPNTTAR